MKTTLFDLYRSPVSIWVEDQLTHDVLTDLWADPQINVLVASGKPGVQYMLRSLPSRVRGRVFGLVDRDFETDNYTDWQKSSIELHRLPAHELENLLLDFEILSELSGIESAPQIEAQAKSFAEKRLYWMACKAVLRDMQSALGIGFPADPPSELASLQEAEQYLVQHAYFTTHQGARNKWNSEQERLTALRQEEQQWRVDLQTSAWKHSFSGKEIFRRLRSDVAKLDSTPVRPPKPSPADRDLNLAKRIAAKMRELGRIPPVLTELRQVLRSKAKL